MKVVANSVQLFVDWLLGGWPPAPAAVMTV
jgi:hypothetical protein